MIPTLMCAPLPGAMCAFSTAGLPQSSGAPKRVSKCASGCMTIPAAAKPNPEYGSMAITANFLDALSSGLSTSPKTEAGRARLPLQALVDHHPR
jgi:hypothetical protein